MTTPVTRRAFLLGAVGAAAAGWVWWRDRGLPSDAAAPATGPVPEPTTSAVQQPTVPPTTVPPTTTTTVTTTTLPPPVRIEAICRDAWGAAAPTGRFTEHTIDRMTVHHTARTLSNNRDAPSAVRGHQRFHQRDRGWADIAYHFIVDLEGNVYECRPTNAVGDTGTNYDPNGHFLVCAEGNFNEQLLPEAQRDALVNVLAWAATQFEAAPETIRGHRDVAATTCPGENIYGLVESGDLAAAVQSRIEAGGVEIEIVCGEAADARIREIESA